MRNLSEIFVGKVYGGGVVFKVNEDGRGLAVALENQSSKAGIKWQVKK